MTGQDGRHKGAEKLTEREKILSSSVITQTGRMMRTALMNAKESEVTERVKRGVLSRWAKKSIFFAYCCERDNGTK
jgi:hypothetical protein